MLLAILVNVLASDNGVTAERAYLDFVNQTGYVKPIHMVRKSSSFTIRPYDEKSKKDTAEFVISVRTVKGKSSITTLKGKVGTRATDIKSKNLAKAINVALNLIPHYGICRDEVLISTEIVKGDYEVDFQELNKYRHFHNVTLDKNFQNPRFLKS